MSGAGDWGTDKARNRLQKDTPGQKVGEEKMEPFKLDGRTKAFKEKVKKLAYSKKKLNAQAIKLLDPKDFDNPLKGYPYNERMTKEHSEELMAFVQNANEAGVEPTELMDAVENWMAIKGYTQVKEETLDDIKKKYAKEIIAFQDDGRDLSKAATDALYAYADSDSIKTDDPDEFDDFVMGLQMGKYRKESFKSSKIFKEDWRKDMERAVDDANARIAKAEKELEAAKQKKADIRAKFKDKTDKDDREVTKALNRSYRKKGYGPY